MVIQQCPRCQLRFQSAAERDDHLATEHGVETRHREPYHYGSGKEKKPLYPDLVDGVDSRRHQVLILSNATLRSERLQDHLMAQHGDIDTLFFLVVPAVEASHATQRVDSFVTVGDPAHPREHALPGDMLAKHRLNEALARMRDMGLQIEGKVGSADPVRAVADGLSEFKADEIVVSALPGRYSKWLAADLPAEIRRRFGRPVTVVEAA